MEEEGIPEQPLVDVAAARANAGTAANGEAADANANDAQRQGAKVDETQVADTAERRGADGHSPGEGTSPRHGSGDEEHGTRGKKKGSKQKAIAKAVVRKTASEKRKKNATSKGGKKIKKPAAPKPRPRLLTRAEILSRHQKWTPIRRGMPSAEELIQILAMAMSIVGEWTITVPLFSFSSRCSS